MIHAGLRDTASLFAARRAPVAVLGATAAAVIVIDEISKAFALHLLPELDAGQTRFFQLGVLHNGDFAWGLSAGPESAAISAVAALVILGLSLAVCGALAAHDRVAPVMLGLIVGAGVANATDGLTAPMGVVDWIAVGAGGGIVVNFADVAVLVGVGLCARTVYRLTLAIRRQHAVRR
ncbi:MAG: signal peptidase II [Gemmatimonadota bacterium]|nr:signal peptidase II [Gemmatimonadota bacterium]